MENSRGGDAQNYFLLHPEHDANFYHLTAIVSAFPHHQHLFYDGLFILLTSKIVEFESFYF
jgi:hypothetical protein